MTAPRCSGRAPQASYASAANLFLAALMAASVLIPALGCNASKTDPKPTAEPNFAGKYTYTGTNPDGTAFIGQYVLDTNHHTVKLANLISTLAFGVQIHSR